MRKSIAAMTALGIGAGSLYLLKRERRARRRRNRTAERKGIVAGVPNDSPALDEQGADQAEAANMLRNIRDAAFDASDEKLALALGRPTEEIETWTKGAGVIDSDVVMKARSLAIQRGVEVE